MTIDAVSASLIAAFIGGAAGVSGSIASSIISRRSEERRHLREVVLRTSLENWRENVALGKLRLERGEGVAIYPLESYIIPMCKIVEMVERKGLTEDEARRCVREYMAINEAVGDEFRAVDRKRRQRA